MYKSATQGTLNKGVKVWYKIICSFKQDRAKDFHSCNTDSSSVQITRFVGVTVTSQIVDLLPRVQLPYEPLFILQYMR